MNLSKTRTCLRVLLLAWLWPTLAFAHDDIALTCSYKWSLDGNKRTEISGDGSIILSLSDDGTVTGNTDKCRQMSGTANNLEVTVGCEFTMGNDKVTERYQINRITGVFFEFWTYNAALVVFGGTCKPAKALF